jgi:hypothetical protein
MDRSEIYLVDIAENDFLYGIMLKDLANNTPVASANNKDFFRIRMAGKRKMCDHLLVSRRDTTID